MNNLTKHTFTVERQDQKHLFTLYQGGKLICRNLSRAQLLKVLRDFTKTKKNAVSTNAWARMLSILLVLVSLGVGAPVKADEAADQYRFLSSWEHLGVSYAIQTITYGAVKTALPDLTRSESLLLSGIITFSLTTTYEFSKQNSTSGNNILMNVIGQGAAVGTVFAFSF